MSNQVEAPSGSVDALGASESSVTKMKGYFTILVPIIVWGYVVPSISEKVFGREKLMIKDPNYNEKEAFATGYDGSYDKIPMIEDLAHPMVEVDAPVTWMEFIFKIIVFCLFLFLFFLIHIWLGQETMLYVTDQPIKHIEKNPPNYLSPAARGLTYEEIWIKTEDNLRLQGWFMFQPEETDRRETFVFFHENAGNLGLRLDWFE